MTIAKYPPTKYWRRLSSVRHGGAQRLQELKAPWKTIPTEKEREEDHVLVLKTSYIIKKRKIFCDNRIK